MYRKGGKVGKEGCMGSVPMPTKPTIASQPTQFFFLLFFVCLGL